MYRVHIMDTYAYTFAIDTRYFCCGQSRSVLGFRLVPLPQIIAEFCPTGMTQILVLFMENPCMFMVFIRKKMCNFHDFLGNLHLNMCRLVVLSMFSKVHHVELSGNKPWWCILPASRSNHPNSTAVHRFARTSFLGLVEKIRQGSSQYLSCRYRMTRNHESHSFCFGWVRLHHKRLVKVVGNESQHLRFGVKYLMWWLHGDVWGVVIPPVVSSHLDDSPYLTRLCHVETMAIAIRAKDKSTHQTTCR